MPYDKPSNSLIILRGTLGFGCGQLSYQPSCRGVAAKGRMSLEIQGRVDISVELILGVRSCRACRALAISITVRRAALFVNM
jgi:hypothetical protein